MTENLTIRGKLLWQCLFLWKVPSTSLNGADIIAAHAWTEESPANDWIASRINLVRNSYKQRTGIFLPLILQRQVADRFMYLNEEEGRQVVYPTPGAYDFPGYTDSRDTAFAQRYICDQRGWKRVILVTWPLHLVRAIMATKGVGLEVCIPQIYPNNPFHRSLFDSRNRPVGANRRKSLLREISARLLYFATKRIQSIDLTNSDHR